MLPVRDIGRSVEFYEKLGFSVERRNDEWRWAMLRFDDCRIMIDQSINIHPESPRQGALYFYPDDIDAYHTEVSSRGIELPQLQTTFYGLTEFRLDDPDGNHLWIGQNKSVDAE